jgi:hypothetical protein
MGPKNKRLAKLWCIVQQAEKVNADLIAISETWLTSDTKDEDLCSADYRVVSRKDRQATTVKRGRCSKKTGGGVLILAKRNISASCIEFNESSPAEICCCSLWSKSGPILLLCVYRPPGSELEEEIILKELPTLLTSTTYSNVIAVGDFNAHKKNELYHTMRSFSMSQSVIGPTAKHSTNTLDMVFSMAKPVKIEKLPSLSDHNAIVSTFETSITTRLMPPRVLKRYQEADWKSMRAFLAECIPKYQFSTKDPNRSARELDKLIETASRKFIPTETVAETKRSNEWWNDDCEQALRELEVTPDDASRLKLKSLAEDAYSLYATSMRSKLSSAHKKSSKLFWKTIKSIRCGGDDGCKRIPAITNKSGIIVTDDCEIANELADYFFHKTLGKSNDNSSLKEPQVTTKISQSMPDLVVDRQVVKMVLERLDLSKASGMGSISLRIAKSCAGPLSYALTDIYRQVLKTGVWPSIWKIGLVIPLFKRSDRLKCKNYRPVCLLPICSKVLEGIIALQLNEHICNSKFLPDCQYGFRRRYSTSHAILSLINDIANDLQKSSTSILNQDDIVGAFDTLPHRQIDLALGSAGVSVKMRKVILSFLGDRVHYVALSGSLSLPYIPANGVAQGSPLGPVLWNSTFSQIQRKVALSSSSSSSSSSSKSSVTQYTFADDSNYKSTDLAVLKAASTALSTSCAEIGLELAPEKQSTMTFSRKRNQASSTKILGTKLDTSLIMDAEVNEIRCKAGGKISQLLRIRNMLSKPVADAIFKAEILPSFEYSAAAIELIATSPQKARLDPIADRYNRVFGPATTDSLQIRRKVGLYTLLYKITVLGEGPAELRRRWPILKTDSNCSAVRHSDQACFIDPVGERRSERVAEQKNPFPIIVLNGETPKCEIGRRYRQAIEGYNSLPVALFETVPDAQEFKKKLVNWLRNN